MVRCFRAADEKNGANKVVYSVGCCFKATNQKRESFLAAPWNFLARRSYDGVIFDSATSRLAAQLRELRKERGVGGRGGGPAGEVGEQALAARGARARDPGDRGGGEHGAGFLHDRARTKLEHEEGRERARGEAGQSAAVAGADRKDDAGDQGADDDALHDGIIG
ncbi:MAG: hypothetical protein HYZ74_01680 [Elusimicrobia bacterium]|nr:hypothetical protein [Elusimicrobiota bacterium]